MAAVSAAAQQKQKPPKAKGKPRGKPFAPGQSGNPGGHSKTPVAVKEFLKDLSIEAAMRLATYVRGEVPGAEHKDIIACCKIVLDASVAKPKPEEVAADEAKATMIEALRTLLLSPPEGASE